ncbi:bifunctional folylpolyglutamate synthase/dihydrofolate synthase [Altererythrobacter aurantiacus]|uniref:Bifunctional folylpolyglutamate synthase/dihydrofolate synthase n=1 Tax=Parapontixanthobacter aurantiacus TaxID=1463599 RepID=A0A844ZE42_9SPHN|nr:folylpolyglutamate synthase/dihydrofolate synthase family protein [Parapontixanthobacter aurantiacus]MXO85523.1 bifunctional folylpolyglutamate synthase/dihydrofolate synthase [Parapontixanthobacter aurantiacus]
MRDFGSSDDPLVQAQLDRLAKLSLPEGRIGLDAIRALLSRLGDPQTRLPPVFHVAGTNGKGSTCAFLRTMLEADGKRVHATISPHLVRYNERIRLAGALIDDSSLASLLEEVLDHAEGINPSFFEVTIAAAFLAFSRTPADACVVEVGLGGRFDATNILPSDVLAACGVAALGIDHERFLLAPEEGAPTDPLARIAFEKAGIAKRGVSLVTLSYSDAMTLEIERAAMTKGAPLAMRGRDWHSSITDTGLHYADRHGEIALPRPALLGEHQFENAALAIAMLRHQDFVTVEADALATGNGEAHWPARLQRLADGPLVRGREVWLDGGHNASAGEALARHFAEEELHLVIGMIEGKNPSAIVRPLRKSLRSITVVPVPNHPAHGPAAFGDGAASAPDVQTALDALPEDGAAVLIAGSLYLAGEVLRLNEELPD